MRPEEPETKNNSRLFLNEVATTIPIVESLSNPSKDKILLTPLEESLLRGRQVFVIDDDIRNVYALANALEQYGMHIITAQNGYECLEMLERGKPIPISF